MLLPRSGPICARGQSCSLIRWQCIVLHRETTRRNPGSMYERTSSRCAAAIREMAFLSTNQVGDIQGSYLPLLHDHLCERQRDPPFESQTSATGKVLNISPRDLMGVAGCMTRIWGRECASVRVSAYGSNEEVESHFVPPLQVCGVCIWPLRRWLGRITRASNHMTGDFAYPYSPLWGF
jgi:hypothetical protein